MGATLKSVIREIEGGDCCTETQSISQEYKTQKYKSQAWVNGRLTIPGREKIMCRGSLA